MVRHKFCSKCCKVCLWSFWDVRASIYQWWILITVRPPYTVEFCLSRNQTQKVNNSNTTTRCEICPKLTIKVPERRKWRRSGIFIANFEHISHLALVFLLLTLNMWKKFACSPTWQVNIYFVENQYSLVESLVLLVCDKLFWLTGFLYSLNISA